MKYEQADKDDYCRKAVEAFQMIREAGEDGLNEKYLEGKMFDSGDEVRFYLLPFVLAGTITKVNAAYALSNDGVKRLEEQRADLFSGKDRVAQFIQLVKTGNYQFLIEFFKKFEKRSGKRSISDAL